MHRVLLVGLAVALTVCLSGSAVLAGPDAHPWSGSAAWIDHVYATGPCANHTTTLQRIDQHVVRSEGALSLRLVFNAIVLGPEDSVDVYSPISGETHVITAATADVWQNTSAYLPGDEVFVYLTLAPGSTGSYELVGAFRGLARAESSQAPSPGTESVCGNVDNRAHTTDDRIGRFMYDPPPTSTMLPWCTAWLAGPDDCVVTAGHCVDQDTAFPYIVEFNVPTSGASGNFVRSGVEDQYPIITASLLWAQPNPARPNDWAVFRLGPNAQTFLGPSYVQSTWFTVSTATPAVAEDIRITGFGGAGNPLPTDLSIINSLHTSNGPYVNSGQVNVHAYQADTAGGDSGSPIIRTSTGNCVGIHTNAGCGDDGSGGATGGNTGTAASHAPFQTALTAVCDQANELSIACAADTTIPCTGNNSASYTTSATITDPQGTGGDFFVFLNGSTTPSAGGSWTSPGGTVGVSWGTTFPLGTTEVRWVIQGNVGSSADCFQDVTVEDTVPPVVTCSVQRRILFPARGALIPPGLPTQLVTDACDPDPTATLTVYSDEADTGAPFTPDAMYLAAANRLLLRSDRAITGNGRVYLLVVHGTDQAGLETYGACAAGVPKLPTAGSIMSVYAEMMLAVAGMDPLTGAPAAPYTNVVLATTPLP